MAVMNVQIADAPEREGTNGLKLEGRTPDTPLSPRVCWATYERDRQLGFSVSLKWRGVPRGDTGGEEYGYTKWSEYVVTQLSPDSCNPWQSDDDDLWHWWVTLDSLLGGHHINGGSWTYNARDYDQINIQVEIAAVVEGDANSYAGTGDLFIGAYPVYTVTDMYVQGEWLVITYTCPGWERKDDRWEILGFTKDWLPVLRPGAWGSSAGQVEKLGWVTIPVSSLQRLVQAGDTVRLGIRWNASYRISGAYWTEWYGPITLSDHGSANDPTGSVTVNPDGSISVDVGDSGSGGAPIDSWQVTIEGGGIEFDQVRATDVSESALLRYPPLDTDFKVQIQGSTVTGGTSSVVEMWSRIDSNGYAMIDPVSYTGERTSDQVRANKNLDWSVSTKQDKTVVKFAGRRRPSVAYGIGGETSISLSWSDSREGTLPKSSDYYGLANSGLCVIRLPGGERYLATIDSLETSEKSGKGCTDVSLSAQEVS